MKHLLVVLFLLLPSSVLACVYNLNTDPPGTKLDEANTAAQNSAVITTAIEAHPGCQLTINDGWYEIGDPNNIIAMFGSNTGLVGVGNPDRKVGYNVITYDEQVVLEYILEDTTSAIVMNPLNTDCTAADVPYWCCTGEGAGTCVGGAVVATNGMYIKNVAIVGHTKYDCTDVDVPYDCCTGLDTGTCHTGRLIDIYKVSYTRPVLDSVVANETDGTGLYIDLSDGSSIMNSHFNYNDVGCTLVNSNAMYFGQNEMTANYSYGFVASGPTGMSSLNLIGNTFENNTVGGAYLAKGIAETYDAIEGVVIQGNHFEGHDDSGSYDLRLGDDDSAHRVKSAVVSGNVFASYHAVNIPTHIGLGVNCLNYSIGPNYHAHTTADTNPVLFYLGAGASRGVFINYTPAQLILPDGFAWGTGYKAIMLTPDNGIVYKGSFTPANFSGVYMMGGFSM